MNVNNNLPLKFNNFLKFKTSILRCSVKKMKSIARDIKGKNIDLVIAALQVSHKRVCGFLHKDLVGIRSNLCNVLNIDSKVVAGMCISFIIIQKRRPSFGTRFKARGRGNRSIVYSTSLELYFKYENQSHDDIKKQELTNKDLDTKTEEEINKNTQEENTTEDK